MMKFEDIQRQGEKEPFGFDFFLTAEKKTAEGQVFLDVGERAFGLDGSVDGVCSEFSVKKGFL